MEIIKRFNKIHVNYCSKMQAVIDFLDQKDSPPVPAEVLVEIANILKSAHYINLKSICLIGVELEETKEALKTKLQSLN